MLFNILSSLLWAYSLILSGHYLYKYLLDKHGVDLTHYIEYIIIILVVLTTTPILMKAFKRKKVA
ncbi:hypothetical protein [Paenimyroides ceti]